MAAKILGKINPDVEIKSFNSDIMAMNFEETFDNEVKSMNVLLNGLDNVPAREYLNIKCVRFKIPYIDAGASRSGLSGHVHPIIPYETACAKCMSRIQQDMPVERGEACVASLPSTMAILASIQIQEMLKLLLKFGTLTDYVMYDMVKGKFFSYETKQDKFCPVCGEKSKEIMIQAKSKISQKDLDNLIDHVKD